MQPLRVNIGCGQSPTRGWRNFDNSLSLRLANASMLLRALRSVGLISREQAAFAAFARSGTVAIQYGDAIKGLPIESGTVEVLYSSHMLEHLDQQDVDLFLKEARRLLVSGGILRIAVPDIALQIHRYLASNDADAFVASTILVSPRLKTPAERVRFLLVGHRNHRWMYDGASLSRLLESQGFVSPQVLKAGDTRISDPGELNLTERSAESVYVEAINP